jgi:hypothetical protein
VYVGEFLFTFITKIGISKKFYKNINFSKGVESEKIVNYIFVENIIYKTFIS